MTDPRKPDPRAAFDYPALDDVLFVIWSANEYRWPDARRQTAYLTDKRRHVVHGFALFDLNPNLAKTFTSEADARAWLAENEAKRPHPYSVIVSTIAELKAARGYVVEG